jgi:hypothetical protein
VSGCWVVAFESFLPSFFDPFFLLLALPFDFLSCLLTCLLLLLGFFLSSLTLALTLALLKPAARRRDDAPRGERRAEEGADDYSARRMEVAAAGRPDAPASEASSALGALELLKAVEALALEAVDLGPASSKLSEFELTVADEDVGENTSVTIARRCDGIAAQGDRRTCRREGCPRRPRRRR